MFPASYFPPTYFAPTFFAERGATAAPSTGGYFAPGYFAGTYFAPAYFPGGSSAPPPGPVDPSVPTAISALVAEDVDSPDPFNCKVETL